MRTPLTATIAALAFPALALAQGPGGVANSGMGQGEARISARSDIRLSMESLPGTNGAQVSALGGRVGARMSALRTCYTDILAQNPTVTGTLRMRVLLDAGTRPPRVEVDRDGTGHAPLVRCVSRTLAGLDATGLTRPTHAIVQLEMQNTAAAGVEASAERAQQAAAVPIEIDGDGNATSSGGTPDGHVRFRVVGRGREAAGAVTAGHRAIFSALPGLLDCRRRAGRRGGSSEGETRIAMTVRDGRAPTSRVTSNTLPGTTTARCLTRTLGAIAPTEGGSGSVTVIVTYAPAETIEDARPE